MEVIAETGKLVTFYHNVECLPEFTDYHMEKRTYRYMESKAQYPFGFGLTYGKVEVTDAEIVKVSEKLDEFGLPKVSVKVTLNNQGVYDTDDVVQIYVKNTDSAFSVANERGERIKDGNHFILYAGTMQPDKRSRELTGMKAVEVVAF